MDFIDFMNFIQPRRPSASPDGGRATPSRHRTNQKRGKRLSLDDHRDIDSIGGDVPFGCEGHLPGHLHLNGVGAGDHAKDNECDDPPIISYDSADADDDARSITGENSQQSMQHQLIRLREQMDDCWEVNLSDDENITDTSVVRLQMMRHSYEKELSENGVEESFLEMNIQQDPTSNSDEKIHIDYYPSSDPGGMSLPEQLLQKRLRRKQRLHEKHEQFVRYQRNHSQEGTEKRQTPGKAIPLSTTPLAIKRSIVSLTVNSSEVCAASPLFPDEQFDDDNASIIATSNGASNDYTNFRSTHKVNEQDQSGSSVASSPLHSLPRRPICVFPDESDRKCIVGCLAAVLASAYAHETAPHLLVKETTIGRGFPMAEDIEQSPSRRSSDEDSVERKKPGSFEAPDTCNLPGRKNNQVLDIKSCRDSSNNTHPETSELHSQQRKKQLHMIQQSRELQKQQHQPKNKTSSFRSRSHSPSSDLAAKKSTASNPMASFHQSFSFTSFNNNMFEKAGSKNPPSALTTELAEIRHRIRRHTIYSELLVSSAEMLLLDPSHAKAFLPMLEGLLTKVDMPSTPKPMNSDDVSRQSWKGRGFGGGGVPSSDFLEENSSAMTSVRPNSSTSDISSRTTQPKEVTSTVRTSLASDKGINEVSNDVESTSKIPLHEGEDAYVPRNTGHDSDTLKPGYLYEPFPSSLRSQSSFNDKQYTQKSHSPQKYAPLDTAIVEADLVSPFLQTLTPGAGFRCIALLLLNHLLRDGRGYDARVRHAFKRLAVIVISHELKVGGILRVELDEEEDLDALMWGDDFTPRSSTASGEEDGFDDADELALLATRKFEAMEHAIAAKLISMMGETRQSESSASSSKNGTSNRQGQSSRAKGTGPEASSPSSSSHGRIALAPKETPMSSHHGISREQLLRGIKVGSAGAIGATLFAITGGLAAPGIAAGLAAVGRYYR